MRKVYLGAALVAVASSLALGASLGLPASAAAATGHNSASAVSAPMSAPLAVVTGSLPSAASGSAPVAVYVLGEQYEAHAKIGQTIAEPVLASGHLRAGSAFRLAIPDSATTRALVATSGAGTMNISVMAVSARGLSTWFTVTRAREAPAGSPAPVAKVGQMPAYDLAALRYAAKVSGVTVADMVAGGPKPSCLHDCINCAWKNVQQANNRVTRIDEMHVASGVTGNYTYQQEADSTFTVGFQAVNEGYTVSGTSGVSNSVAVTAGFSPRGFFSHHVNGRYDYHKDLRVVGQGGGVCPSAGAHKQLAVAWDGTAVVGNAAVERSSGDTCRNAQLFVVLSAGNGNVTKSSGHSVFYEFGVADPMGFSFGDRTGYSKNVTEGWTNHNKGRSFLCGPNNKVGNSQRISQWDIVYNYNKAR